MGIQKRKARKPRRPNSKINSNRSKTKSDSILSLIGQQAEASAPAKPEPLRAPPAPVDLLDDIGIKEWQRVAELLTEGGLLTDLDTGVLMLYCDAYSDFVRAVRELKKTDKAEQIIKTGKRNNGQYRNPWYDVKKKAGQEMAQYAAVLGLTAYDRGRISGNGGKKPERRPANEFDEFKN